jgi:hypothetical protein
MKDYRKFIMKKIFIIVAPFILVGCAPKSTPESEALLNEIYAVQSKTKVGINYMDYSKVAQDIQIKLDNFERSEKSRKIKYAGSLVTTAENYISAADKKYSEDWSPQADWWYANFSNEYTQNCKKKGKDCYGYDDQINLTIDISSRHAKEDKEFFDALNK